MKLIDQLLIGKDLSVKTSEEAFQNLFRKAPASAFDPKLLLVLLRRKGEHANELAGLVRTIRRLEPPLLSEPGNLIDGCGTGGDGLHSFNISTLACLAAAACGARVAKHGNRGISSACGSSELMSRLGVNVSASPQTMLKALKTVGFGYFHAPRYHPLFKRIQPIRHSLAQKGLITIFNMAGPLLNPLRPPYQLIGVPRPDWAYVLAGALSKLSLKRTADSADVRKISKKARSLSTLNAKRAVIVSSFKGYDELTATAKALWIEVSGGKMKTKLFVPPQNLYLPKNDKELKGGTPSLNKKIALDILSGRDHSVRRNTVALNAAAMLLICGRVKNVSGGVRLALQALDSKEALNLLKRLARCSHGVE